MDVKSRVSKLIGEIVEDKEVLLRFVEKYDPLSTRPSICDFVFGNPHDLPLPAFGESLSKWTVPQSPDWFAYKRSEPEAQELVAETLNSKYGIGFKPPDIAMTNGAFGALAVTLRAVVDPGDEVVFVTPPWFFYDSLIKAVGGIVRKVEARPPTFDLDPSDIAGAISDRTRAVIVNTPHNPTGRIYGPEVLAELGLVLAKASEKIGRTIYLISDEAYSRIVFEGRTHHTPAAFYPNTFLIYTYGKTLLTPGQRIGYIAIPPSMPQRRQMRDALFMSQVATGWAFPNAVMQYALTDIEGLSIDINALEKKRDRMVDGLMDAGYQIYPPEGTFYLLPKSPIADDIAFADYLADRDVLVLPGRVVELPGYFRISITASEDMVERSLPVFAEAIKSFQ